MRKNSTERIEIDEQVQILFVLVLVTISSAALFALMLVDLKSAFFLHR